jgi:dipeptidyl aminopeptidase/acylaminoacyl peptidase
MIAYQGEVVSAKGTRMMEVFLVELPKNLTAVGEGPLVGTASGRPAPPAGTVQRRLTFTESGLSRPRHWLRSSPDGSRIGFLMRDELGIVQMWTVSPAGDKPRQITRAVRGVESAFSWSPDGKSVAVVMDASVGIVDAGDGRRRALAANGSCPIRPEACVFSPDGRQIAYVRVVDGHNQIFVADLA